MQNKYSKPSLSVVVFVLTSLDNIRSFWLYSIFYPESSLQITCAVLSGHAVELNPDAGMDFKQFQLFGFYL